MTKFLRALFGAGRKYESPNVLQARARAAERRANRLLPDTRSEWDANASMGGAR